MLSRDKSIPLFDSAQLAAAASAKHEVELAELEGRIKIDIHKAGSQEEAAWKKLRGEVEFAQWDDKVPPVPPCARQQARGCDDACVHVGVQVEVCV